MITLRSLIPAPLPLFDPRTWIDLLLRQSPALIGPLNGTFSEMAKFCPPAPREFFRSYAAHAAAGWSA
jgi:hypothetical protein